MRHLVCAALLLAAPVSAQTLADNSEGRIRVAGNELLIDAKNLDAAAIRLGAPEAQGGLGKISFDALAGSRKEMVLFIGAQSPGRGGEFSLNLLRPGGSSTDANMVKVLWGNHEQGIHFTLPIFAPNLGGGSGGLQDYIASPDGRFRLYMQGDGNVVRYEIVETTLCPRWSEFTGTIPPSAMPAPCN